jgi:CRISPR system Cascade subunit CasA
MVSSFNLIDEQWIPCITSGSSKEELGLLDTLLRAHTLLELHDPSPLVTASLHRLLLAVLHRVFGPESVEEWQRLWQTGHFAPKPIEAYLKQWHSRFNLFDDQFPFCQVCKFNAKTKLVEINDIVHEYARGNNPTLFDHTNDANCLALFPSEAARKLISYQSFSLGGLSGLGKDVAFTDAPLAKYAVFLVRGRNLFETLMLNLVKYDKDEPVPIMHQDSPVWERGDPGRRSDTPQGYLDYLTWQTRLLRLVHETSKGSVAAREIEMAPGYRLPKDITVFDPALFYKKDKGWQPLRLSGRKALWRDSSTLFSATQEQKDKRFGLLHWLWQLVDNDVIPRNYVYNLEAFGLCALRAKVDFWRHERMPLPLAYLTDQDRIHDLSIALQYAEDAADAVAKAIWTMANRLANDKDSRNNITNHLKAFEIFWSRLERPFYGTLTEIPAAPEIALNHWVKTLRQTVWAAFEQSTRGLDHSARTLQALEAARGNLAFGLAKVLPKEVNND